MRLVDLSMTVEECDSTPFAKEEAYFKPRPIVRWEDKGGETSSPSQVWRAGIAASCANAADAIVNAMLSPPHAGAVASTRPSTNGATGKPRRRSRKQTIPVTSITQTSKSRWVME